MRGRKLRAKEGLFKRDISRDFCERERSGNRKKNREDVVEVEASTIIDALPRWTKLSFRCTNEAREWGTEKKPRAFPPAHYRSTVPIQN